MSIPDDKVERAVTIDYTNYRGERAIRHVLPVSFHFEVNNFHGGTQWFMRGEDLTKGCKTRMFAMSSIHSWKPLDRVALRAAGIDPKAEEPG